MILDSSLKSIRVVLLEAKTTTDCDVTASYADQTGAGFLPGSNDTVTNGVTPVTIVAAPGTGGQRSVQEITVHNNDTVPHTVILQLDDNSTIRIFREQLIAVGADFAYSPNVLPASSVVPVPAAGNALDFIRINAAGNGYEVQTPAQTLGDIAGGVSGAINSTTVGATTPSSGAFTTVSASGLITPSQTIGIVGTTTNNAANAGSIGEVISANLVQGSAISLSNGVVGTVTSIALTAGDWDVSGEVWLTVGTGAAAAIEAGISSSGAFQNSDPGFARNLMTAAFTASSTNIIPVKTARVLLSGSATYNLLALVSFGSGACTAWGNIWARRAR